MLLIAGLLGIVASGLLFVLPEDPSLEEEDGTPGTADGDAAESKAEDGSSPLSEAFSEDEALVPAASESVTGSEDDESETHSSQVSDADPNPAPIRDQVAGEHLSDVMHASEGRVILHDSDAVFGNSASDSLSGGPAQDLMLGNNGDDTLHGGDDRDGLYGGEGDDQLHGNAGDDILHGEWGNDQLSGNSGDDLLIGGDGDDTLDGDEGNDRLFGMFGRDLMIGGAGDDVLDGTQSDIGGGHDQDGSDTLIGGDGHDTLAAGAADHLSGGAGHDLFLFRAPSVAAFGSDLMAPPHDAAFIEDFDRTEDAIEILYDKAFETTPGTPPALTFIEDDLGTEVHLNGTVVVRLAPGTVISAADIHLVQSA